MDTKTYKMLKTAQGSRDGVVVETFRKDEIYELDSHLAEQFYSLGAVDEVKAKKSPVEENKAIDPVEENKASPEMEHVEPANGPILHPGQDEGAEEVGADFVPDGQTPEDAAQEEEITGEKSPGKAKGKRK